jgi:hypothetical protein
MSHTPEMLELLRSALYAINMLLSGSYEFEQENGGGRWRECQELSPLNEDKTLRLVHAHWCNKGYAIRVMREIEAAIRNEGGA